MKASAEPISKPLAAYRLGYLSVAIRLWLDVLWELPWHEGVEDAVPLAADQLGEARLALADEIHTNVFNELPLFIQKSLEINKYCIELLREHVSWITSQRIPPGEDDWKSLRTLADRALSEVHPLRPLYDLGIALGNYQLALRYYNPPRAGVEDLGALPDIRPFADAVSRLPEEQTSRSDLLRSMCDFRPLLEGEDGQSIFLETFYRAQEDDWGHRSTDVDYASISSMMIRLDDLIQASLRIPTTDTPPTEPIASSAPPIEPFASEIKPRWDKTQGDFRITYDGLTCRTVSRRGINILKILDAFEQAGWSVEIQNPLAEPIARSRDAQTLSESIRSLNKNIKYIKFRSNGRGTGIIWEPSESP